MFPCKDIKRVYRNYCPHPSKMYYLPCDIHLKNGMLSKQSPKSHHHCEFRWFKQLFLIGNSSHTKKTMYKITVFQCTVYANVMCHFQQNMFYSGIRGTSDILHSSKIVSLWWIYMCGREPRKIYLQRQISKLPLLSSTLGCF